MNRRLEWIKGFLIFLAIAAGLLLLIAVLHRIPGAVDKEGMRPYASIEHLIGETGFDAVLVPSYFPEGINWPARLVIGQRRPFMAAVMEFDGKDTERVLVISESESAGFKPGYTTRFSDLRQSVKLDLKGRSALVETGLCHGGYSCSRISWQEDGLFLKLFMRAPSMELIRIAESMLR